MQSSSFKDSITRNKRNSLLLVTLVSAILFSLVYIFAYLIARDQILVVLSISGVFIAIYVYSTYMYGENVVLSATKVKAAEGREYQYLRDTVEGLSIAAGVPTPKTYVIESNEINAFATGRDPKHSSLAVTTGSLKELNRQELEGVVAHEISHIRNRDVLFMTLVAVLVGLVAILSHIILRSFWYGGIHGSRGKRRGGGEIIILLIGFILAILAPIIVRIVQFAISRRREYLADSSGVDLTRYPEGLASALEKIMQKNRGNIDVSEAVSHLFFADPTHSALDKIFSTHPPLAERIKRLRSM